MRNASHTSDVILPWPLVAAAGWLLPGLGHVILGHTRRGVIVGLTLLTLFVTGLLIGGISAVDRRNATLWFAGQALIGPAAFAAGYYHQFLEDRRELLALEYEHAHGLSRGQGLHEMVLSGEPVTYRTSVNRVNELGTLYATLAGVMNLLVILDSVGRASEGSKLKVKGASLKANPGGAPS